MGTRKETKIDDFLTGKEKNFVDFVKSALPYDKLKDFIFIIESDEDIFYVFDIKDDCKIVISDFKIYEAYYQYYKKAE